MKTSYLTKGTKEIFKDIEMFKGFYQISNEGNVKSLYNDIILSPSTGTKGYPQVSLQKTVNGIKYKRSIAIHRLVAEAFIKSIPGKTQVNHINGDKTNNNVSNLEWCTNGENIQHSYDKLGRSKIRPKWTYSTYEKLCIKINQYSIDGEFIKQWDSLRGVTKSLGFDHSSISKNCRGKAKSSYGFIWKYA